MAAGPAYGDGSSARALAPERGLVGSIATQAMGAGPGVRFAVHLLGCPLRCPSCPDPRCRGEIGGRPSSAGDLCRQMLNFADCMRVSGGGVTVSGGEPLRQVPFARALLAQARDLGLHTALDTSGFGNPFALRGLVRLADLVVVDASAWDLARGEGTRPSMLLPRLLKEGTQSVRLRVAILPGINDGAAGLARLADLAQVLPRLERVEVVAWQGLPGLDGIEACPLLSSLAPVGPEALRSARNVFRMRGLRAE